MNDARLIVAKDVDVDLRNEYLSNADGYITVAGMSIFNAAIDRARCVVMRSPTIDAVSVVRCFECANRGDKRKCPMCFDESDGIDFYQVDNTDDDGFCHYGERKEDNHATD